jgi:hypothetical protein
MRGSMYWFDKLYIYRLKVGVEQNIILIRLVLFLTNSVKDAFVVLMSCIAYLCC